MKNFFSKIALLAFILLVSSNSALAASLNNDTSTLVTQKINAGALTLEAPSDVTLADITTSTDQQVVTGTASQLKVDDARGKKVGQQPGWSATVTANNFSDGVGVTASVIPVTGFTVTPSAVTTNSGSSTGISSGSAHTFTGSNDPATVMTASSGNGKGQYQSDLGLSLIVPANSDAADYSSTLTFTVQ